MPILTYEWRDQKNIKRAVLHHQWTVVCYTKFPVPPVLWEVDFVIERNALNLPQTFLASYFFLYAHGIMSYVHFPPFYPQVCLPPVFIFPWLSWLPSTSPILPLRKPCQFKSMTLCDLGRAPDKWMEIYIKTASVCINVCVCVCVCVCV